MPSPASSHSTAAPRNNQVKDRSKPTLTDLRHRARPQNGAPMPPVDYIPEFNIFGPTPVLRTARLPAGNVFRTFEPPPACRCHRARASANSPMSDSSHVPGVPPITIVGVAKLKARRGYVLIGIFAVAAFLTPPDPISQINFTHGSAHSHDARNPMHAGTLLQSLLSLSVFDIVMRCPVSF